MKKGMAAAVAVMTLLTASTSENAYADTFLIQETLQADLLTKELKRPSNVEAAQKRLGTNPYQSEQGTVKIIKHLVNKT